MLRVEGGTRRRAARLALAVLAVLALCGASAQTAWAHAVSIGQSRIVQDGQTVRYDLAVSYDELAQRIGLAARLASHRPAVTDAERAAALRGERAALERYLGAHVRVLLDGTECDDRLGDVEVTRHRGELFAALSLSYRCEEAVSGAYEIRYDLFFDSSSDAAGAAHANVVDFELGAATGRFVFEPDEQRLAVGGLGALATAGRFAALGFEHIMSGVDHLLFVLVLLLGARSVRSVLKVVTAFTAAHSVTLALAALGVVRVPAGIVEPLIALSIAYVAVDNIARGESRHRFVVVFGFGLVHGLGFAGALSVADAVSWRAILSLFSFNAGVELGQLLLIMAAWPLLVRARRLSWERVAHVAASGLVATLGAFWAAHRVLA